MKQRLLRVLVLIPVLLSLLAGAALADTGPKPSVTLDIKGLDGQRCYVTLLAQEESTGPWSKQKSLADSFAGDDVDEVVWTAFNDYRDPDGLYFLGWFADCTDTDRAVWSYYPPGTFRVLLYLPDSGRFVAAEELCSRYAFHSYFTATVKGSGDDLRIAKVKQSYSYGWEAASLAARVVVTLAVELAIALFFGFRAKRQLRLILVVNVLTQIVLNVLLNMIAYRSGPLAFVLNYIWMEAAVFVIEGVVYALTLRRLAKDPEKRVHPWIYALVANVVSFAAGMALARVIPGIF